MRANSGLIATVALTILISIKGWASADPCGMVPPIYPGQQVPLARVGEQQTYVFYKDGVETFVIRPGFTGKVEEFGMLIPFPTPPAIRKVPDHIFPHIEAAVDPPEVVVDLSPQVELARLGNRLSGQTSTRSLGLLKKSEVRVLREEAVGMYEVAVLEAGSPAALKKWMDQHGYRYPDGMDKACEDYVEAKWCFVAVKTKVGGKAGVDPRPGQRDVDTKLPAGSTFDGHVQGMGFRFEVDELVVPMRLSAFNKGELRNIVYLLTEGPRKIRFIPEEYVMRQVSGDELHRNLTGPLPLRIIGGTLKDIPESRRKSLEQERDPTPHNGAAKDLFASDLLAFQTGQLALPHEEREKELLRIGERFGLRGPEIDKLNEQSLSELRRKTVEGSLEDLKQMTLTVIDGDFPRELLGRQNLQFAEYKMPARRNRPTIYDAKTKSPAPEQAGELHLGQLELDFDKQIAAVQDPGKKDSTGGTSSGAIIAFLGVPLILLGVSLLVRRRKSAGGGLLMVIVLLGICSTAGADPCGMVPPIYPGQQIPLARVGLQQTYVFYKDGVETFVIRPGFTGKVDEFGMLIPFPTPPAIRKVPDQIFQHLAAAVDPPEVVVDLRERLRLLRSNVRKSASGARNRDALEFEDEVKVLRQEAVGMYEVAVLEAGSAAALKRWMDDHGYQYPDGMDKPCDEYVEAGWCFVAVKTKVGQKEGVDPRPGQRDVDPKLPQGSTFDGHVQGMGFRFEVEELVVPMRLSAFNKGELRNVVYLLTDGPRRIRAIPEEYVVRQVSGEQLFKNVTEPLPLRIIGGTEAEIPEYRRATLKQERDPAPHNGAAAELFASDLFAAASGELSLPHEEREKELLRIGERFGLRGAEIDELNMQSLADARRKTVAQSLAELKDMTLTVVDGDFPRELLRDQNLTFASYKMSARRNNAQSYDAKLNAPAPNKEGVLILGSLSSDAADVLSSSEPEIVPVGRRQLMWLISSLSAILTALVGFVFVRKRLVSN